MPNTKYTTPDTKYTIQEYQIHLWQEADREASICESFFIPPIPIVAHWRRHLKDNHKKLFYRYCYRQWWQWWDNEKRRPAGRWLVYQGQGADKPPDPWWCHTFFHHLIIRIMVSWWWCSHYWGILRPINIWMLRNLPPVETSQECWSLPARGSWLIFSKCTWALTPTPPSPTTTSTTTPTPTSTFEARTRWRRQIQCGEVREAVASWNS